MKTKKFIYGFLIVFILAIVGIGLVNIGATMMSKPTENFNMCSGHFPKNPDIKAVSIHLCENVQGDKIYELFYDESDAPADYFDLNRSSIAQCGIVSGGKCADIIKYYSCDRDKNLWQELCNPGK